MFAWHYLVNYILTGRILETFSKEFLISIGVIATAFILTVYFMIPQPDYFNQGVDQLHESTFLKIKSEALTPIPGS
jgi:hypothetical protein